MNINEEIAALVRTQSEGNLGLHMTADLGGIRWHAVIAKCEVDSKGLTTTTSEGFGDTPEVAIAKARFATPEVTRKEFS